jgi:hypothetical protein
MKIAFCFSGIARSIEKTKDQWLSIMDGYDADVYASFWDFNDRDELDAREKFAEIYSPKQMEVENFQSFNETTLNMFRENLQIPTNLNFSTQTYVYNLNVISMYYKIWRANMLANSGNYDIIVRCRTDLFPKDRISFKINDMLNLPVGYTWISSWKNSGGPSDSFAYGNKEMMNFYSSIFLFISHYHRTGHYFFVNEQFVKLRMVEKNIKIRFLPIKMMYCNNIWNNHFAPEFQDPNFTELIISSESFLPVDPDPNNTFYKK